MKRPYASTINAGLGLLESALVLLKLWEPAMDANSLRQRVLESGSFPQMSARRLRNFVVEGFGGVFLDGGEKAALHLSQLQYALSSEETTQFVYLYTCRRHAILGDFVAELYWPLYAAGRNYVTYKDAHQFVEQAVQEGKTTTDWSEGTIKRVARYLLSYCADFDLIEQTRRQQREITPIRIHPTVAVYLAYDLHFADIGDNNLLNHQDWALFGLDRNDVLEEMRRMTLQKWLIVQSAAGATRIDWLYDSMEDVIDAITERKL